MRRAIVVVAAAACHGGAAPRAAVAPAPVAMPPPIVTPAPLPAPPPGPIAIVVDGDRVTCGASDRCAGHRTLAGTVAFDHLDPAAVVSYGDPPAPSLDLRAIALATPPATLDTQELFGRDVATVPITITWPDGAVARGDLPLSSVGMTIAIDELLRGVATGPVPLPGDAPPPPAPRAMWIATGGAGPRLYGTAASFAEIDRVLIIAEQPRAVRCGKTTVEVSDWQATLYQRQTGAVIDQHLARAGGFPCGPDQGGQLGQLHLDGFGAWAWTEPHPKRSRGRHR